MCIYTVEQGSFVSNVSPNGVRLVGIQQKFLVNVWGEGKSGCVAEDGWSSEDGISSMPYMKLHLLTHRRQSVSVVKDQLVNAVKVNDCYLFLESSEKCIVCICGQSGSYGN